MRLESYVLPNNLDSLGIIGYLIVVNRQVHSYQIDALTKYLNCLGLNIENTVIGRIIDGKDDALPYETSLDAFSTESSEVQEDIYYILLLLSQLDNVMDTNEEKMMSDVISKSKFSSERRNGIELNAKEDALAYRDENNSLFERPDLPSKGNWQLFKEKCIRFWKKLKNEKLVEEVGSDVDYKKIIQKCAIIAGEDFGVVHPCYDIIINNNNRCMESLLSYKKSLPLDNDISASVAMVVKTYIDAINENVIEQTKTAEVSLVQKERTLPDFTISLLGRTKAGKSTLHAILTHQGYDKIGVGRQRTTKYNRVYQWNLLRLIDTPGIGSAEAAGRTDDEIAQSVLGESDIVCLVVVDDSILKDILDLIDKVAQLNKPIIILLNHKENIRNAVRYRRFIAEPTKWLTDKGESNLQGHIDRITTYAQSRGYKDLVQVKPVFLLAAQMSEEPEYANDKTVLWQSSNVDAFNIQLKNWIVYSGSIKRSQTIIDEAVQMFEISKSEIKKANIPVEKRLEELKKDRFTKVSKLKNDLKETEIRVQEIYKTKLEHLANIDALNFAEAHYKEKDLSDKWNAYIKEIGFEDEHTSDIEKECSLFVSQADSVVQELFEDLYFNMRSDIRIADIKVPIVIDIKNITLLGGSALGVAGAIVLMIANTNPIGWVLTIGGTLIALGSMLFKSKDKRRQEAVNKVFKSIQKSVLSESESKSMEISKSVSSELMKQIERIDHIYEDLINGLQEMQHQSYEMEKMYSQQIDWLNKVYAWRIVQYLNNTDDPYEKRIVDGTIKGVDRTNKGRIAIKTSKKNRGDVHKLDGIIADKVDFV